MLYSDKLPAEMNKNLDAICISDAGKLLVASSNLTGRYWTSNIWLYDDPDFAPNLEKSLAGQDLEAGVNDLKFNGTERFICCLDSGAIQEFKIEQDHPVTFSSLFYMCRHDNLVSSISVSKSGKKVVSASYDRGIKCWDLEEAMETYSFPSAHSDIIYAVRYHPEEENIFVSCSKDGNVLLWDTRQAKPARLLSDVSGKGQPTTIEWQPDDTSDIAIGNSLGEIIITNMKSERPRCMKRVHRRPVFKISFPSFKSSLLASCSDDNLVSVMDTMEQDAKIIYEDRSHSDYVRSLCWNPLTKKLYSSGWDKNIFSHSLLSEPMSVNGS